MAQCPTIEDAISWYKKQHIHARRLVILQKDRIPSTTVCCTFEHPYDFPDEQDVFPIVEDAYQTVKHQSLSSALTNSDSPILAFLPPWQIVVIHIDTKTLCVKMVDGDSKPLGTYTGLS